MVGVSSSSTSRRLLPAVTLLLAPCLFLAVGHETNAIDIFGVKTTIYVNVSAVIQELVNKVTDRVKCVQSGLLHTECAKCLQTERITQLLGIDPRSKVLTKRNVEDLSILFFHHLLYFRSLCSARPSGCSNFTVCEDEVLQRIRSAELVDSLEDVLRDVKGGLDESHVNQCFSAESVTEELQVSNHSNATNDEIKMIITSIMHRIVQGQCIDVGESVTDFLDDIFHLYGDEDSSTISFNGLKRMVRDLQKKGFDGHGHDHGHDHSHDHNHHDHDHDHEHGTFHSHHDHEHSEECEHPEMQALHDHLSSNVDNHEHHGDINHSHDSDHGHYINHNNKDEKHSDSHTHNEQKIVQKATVQYTELNNAHNNDNNSKIDFEKSTSGYDNMNNDAIQHTEFLHDPISDSKTRVSLPERYYEDTKSMTEHDHNHEHNIKSEKSSDISKPNLDMAKNQSKSNFEFNDTSSTHMVSELDSHDHSLKKKGILFRTTRTLKEADVVGVTPASSLKSELFHQVETPGGKNAIPSEPDDVRRVYLLQDENLKLLLEHDHSSHHHGSLASQCLSIEELVTKFGHSPNSSFTRAEFLQLCPALVQQIVSGVCENTVKFQPVSPPTAELYGYSSLAVLIISLTSLAGVLLLPILAKQAYHYVMAGFVGLAFSTLLGDALLHLLPQALGVHSHDGEHSHDHGSELDPFIWKQLGIFIAIYVLFLFEAITCAFSKTKHSHHHNVRNHGHSHIPETLPRELTLVSVKTKSESNTRLAISPEQSQSSFDTEIADTGDIKKPEPLMLAKPVFLGMSMVALTVTLGDSIHNFGDGLAIGAAFSSGIRSGLSTSIAVFCHELPHEFGDFVVLLSTGLSFQKSLCINFLSGLTCFFGLYIGIQLGDNEVARTWIMAVTGGIFLYVALVEMLPELKEHKFGSPLKMLLVKNIGILAGIIIMLLISIYEHNFYT